MNKSASYTSIAIEVRYIYGNDVTYTLSHGRSVDKIFTWHAFNHDDRRTLTQLRDGGRYWINVCTDLKGIQHWVKAHDLDRPRKQKAETPHTPHPIDSFIEF